MPQRQSQLSTALGSTNSVIIVKVQHYLGKIRRYAVFYYYAFFVVAYLVISLITPAKQATLTKYHLTTSGMRLLELTFLLPLVAIWFAAIFGYFKLHNYGALIKRNKDGKEILKLSHGILVLAIGLPCSGTISVILNFIAAYHSGFTNAASIINNYVSLAFPLVAFAIMNSGARGLLDNTRQRPERQTIHIFMVAFIAVAVFYCYAIFTKGSADRISIYHLSNWLVALTLVGPYLYTWFMGAATALELFAYTKKIPGILYKQSWWLVALGLGIIIFVSIALQYLTTLTVRLTSLSLGSLLLIIYLLLFAIGTGYVIMALGAHKLQKIEEI